MVVVLLVLELNMFMIPEKIILLQGKFKILGPYNTKEHDLESQDSFMV